MWHVKFAIRRPITITMIFAALAGLGVMSSRLLPLEFLPELEIPFIAVVAPYENSTPEEVEREITRPVEEALATLSGLKRMNSTSSAGQSQTVLVFDWDQDMGAAGIDARSKVDSIQQRLPKDLRRVQVFTMDTGDQPIVTLRISSQRDLSDAYSLLDRNLKRRLERLPGVSKVELEGVNPQEIRILLDPGRIAAHGIELNQLQRRLERSNFAVSGGLLTSGGLRLSVRPTGEFRTLDEIRGFLVDDSGVRLSDIARVELRSPDRNYGRRLDGAYAIGINVYRSTGANMVEVADRVIEEIAAVGELPAMQGITLFELDNQANGVRQSLSDLLQAGLIGAFLAVIVLYLFLRHWVTTLIVTLSVPFSLLVTLAALYFAGFSLNILTMMGLMLAIGMLVDNAVVVTESVIRQRHETNDSPEVATLRGVREVGLAVIAGTFTTIAVYLPISWGDQNQITIFLKAVGITITVAVFMSLLVAQTLIPMLVARLKHTPPAPPNWLTGLTESYVGALNWCLSHRWWTLLGVAIILGSTYVPTKLGDFEFFPEEPSRRLFLRYNVNDIYPLDRVQQSVEEIEGYLLDNAAALDIRHVYSYWDEGRAESTILLHEGSRASVATEDVVETIEANLPEIVIGKPGFQSQRQGNSEGFSIRVTGESTEQLVDIGLDVIRILDATDKFDSITWDMTAGRREVQVRVDRDRAAAQGLTTEAVAQSIAVAMKGDYLRDFRGPDGETQVRLAFRDSDKQTLQDLAKLPLYNEAGQKVDLGAVADLSVHPGPRRIQRFDRRTSVTISGNPSRGVTMSELKPLAKQLLDQYPMPSGYSWNYGRGFDQDQETQSALVLVIFLAVALIVLVMAALFESTVYPLSIVVSIVFSVIGVLWTFLLTGTTFSFMAYIGILILIGVVVNNGIVLVDYINLLRKKGIPRDQAVLTAGRHRLRPILMTVATTVLGLLPVALGTTQIGGNGPAYYPMARAIMGGLIFSTIISLLIVPYLYVLLDSLVGWTGRVIALSRKQLEDSPA